MLSHPTLLHLLILSLVVIMWIWNNFTACEEDDIR